ncbi:MAG TPA: cytochrome P450 [Candidatus Dormibacteraeota bacterium]|nr:cytochrome P450 [Candidatus Dormibacteraeota bacterium]
MARTPPGTAPGLSGYAYALDVTPCPTEHVPVQSQPSPRRSRQLMEDAVGNDRPWPGGPPSKGRSGALAQLRRDRLHFLKHCADEYGDFVPFRLGQRQVVYLNRADYVETVISKGGDAYSKNYLTDFFHPILRQQLLLSDTGSWLEQRRVAQPALRPDRLPAYARVMVERADAMVSDWSEGQTLDVSERMRRLTLEILARSLFDVDIAREAAETGDIVDRVLEDVNQRANGRAFVPFVLPTPANLRLLRILKRLDFLLDRLISDRRLDAAGRKDLLSMMVTSAEDGGHGFDNDETKLTALPLFFAGHETTAVTLTWTLLLLSRHPEVADRVRTEIEEVLGERLPEPDDVRSLRYLNWVVQEALRLYPPIWGFGREAMQDTQIDSYTIPKGTTVFMSQWVLQRDRRYFDRPEEFDPERWSDGLAGRLPRGAYVPFGLGSRRCLGNVFALTEAVLVLATICRRFNLQALSPEDPPMDPLITLRPHGPVPMRVESRPVD